MTPSTKTLLFAALLVLVACASSSDPSSSWSRSYIAPREEVVDAVVEVLEGEHYLVEVDREKGRVNAEPSRTGGSGRANLVVRIEPRKGKIAVDVQARAGAEFVQRAGNPAEAQVLEFLHQLDLRLRAIENR